MKRGGPHGQQGSRPPLPHRLFSATAATGSGLGSLAVFYAATAPDAQSFRETLEVRIGETAANGASIVVGFDSDDWLARALLGQATIRLLRWASAHPGSPLTEGLEVQHFQLIGSADVWAAA